MSDIPTSIHLDNGKARIGIEMPYEADVSVNHAYNRGIPACGLRPHVAHWATALRLMANHLIAAAGEVNDGSVILDLAIIAPKQRGRMPDTSNFRKVTQDVLAAALSVDDSIFGGTDTPARRAVGGEDPAIIISLEWVTQ